MQYILGQAVFEVAAPLRDDTTYIYAPPDDSRTLRVTPIPGTNDADRVLSSTKAAFEEFMAPAIIYSASIKVTGPAGVPVPAFEGELTDPVTETIRRFGIVALAEGDNTATFLLLAPRAALLPEFQHLVKSVRFLASVMEPAFVAVTGMTRRQAAAVSFEVPADWSRSTTLLFSDPSAEDVTLRVTLDDPPAKQGAISLETELPAVSGDRVVVQNATVVPGRPNAKSWTGDWTVEHGSPLGTRTVVLRKACILLRGGETLTAYGKALEKNSPRLTAAWETFLQTVRERTP
jgi:hypothetical protein